MFICPWIPHIIFQRIFLLRTTQQRQQACMITVIVESLWICLIDNIQWINLIDGINLNKSNRSMALALKWAARLSSMCRLNFHSTDQQNTRIFSTEKISTTRERWKRTQTNLFIFPVVYGFFMSHFVLCHVFFYFSLQKKVLRHHWCKGCRFGYVNRTDCWICFHASTCLSKCWTRRRRYGL